MIVGNVSEYIERCLRSFIPIADEVVLVRAIGNQQPDSTFEIAEKVCSELGIPLVKGVYQNAADHDWPHVDSFAAARQMSFDLASGEYCFWADSDDILKSGADKIRKHAERGEYAAYVFPYEIFGKGVVVNRERMMRKDCGKWNYPVHECFKFLIEPVTAASDDGVIVQHMPHTTKTGSNQRNLRILESIPPEEMNSGLKYHLYGELNGAGRKDEAAALAVELLTKSDLGKDEKYDLLLSLVVNTNSIEERKALLHEAHKLDPARREALGVLACCAMDAGQNPQALAYARQMAATLIPHDECWNSRRAFYGYIGDDIYQQALRVNGLTAEAENLRKACLVRAGGPRITLLHATRGRPALASKCRKTWLDLAEKPELVEHIFAIDKDDTESQPLKRFHHVEVLAGGGCVRAWNAAAGSANSQVLVQLSDDWTPPPEWDKLILERIGDVSKPSVLAVSDGTRTDKLLCMAICTRNYYALDWFLFHPDFTGVYSDNWFTAQAYARNAVIEARDLVFTHKHPAFGTAPVDHTYAMQNAPERYTQGEKVLDHLLTGKDWSSVPGFFNYWPFYGGIADHLKDGDSVAEIGCWMGRSLIYLAQRCKAQGKRVKFYAVDTFKGESNQKEHEATVRECGGKLRAAFEENIKRCGVSDMVEIIEGDSADSASKIADKSLAFAWIDAAHDYDSVCKDIKAWTPKIKPGGILAGHDADWHEVAKAVSELTSAKIEGCVWATQL